MRYGKKTPAETSMRNDVETHFKQYVVVATLFGGQIYMYMHL